MPVADVRTLSVRVRPSLARVLEESAGMKGRTLSDELRLALELYTHLTVLFEATTDEGRAGLEESGRDPEAFVVDVRETLRRDARSAFSRDLPDDLLDELDLSRRGQREAAAST